MAEIFRLDALLSREARHGLRAARILPAPNALFAIGLARGQAFGAQHQAARRGIHA